jgi:hypothetical protein
VTKARQAAPVVKNIPTPHTRVTLDEMNYGVQGQLDVAGSLHIGNPRPLAMGDLPYVITATVLDGATHEQTFIDSQVISEGTVVAGHGNWDAEYEAKFSLPPGQYYVQISLRPTDEWMVEHGSDPDYSIAGSGRTLEVQ